LQGPRHAGLQFIFSRPSAIILPMRACSTLM
jgi:hypothetical protein